MSNKPQLSEEEFEKALKGMGGGAHEVETSWPDPVNWETTIVLTGKVVELEKVTMDDRTTRRASIETASGVVSLWESASLRKLFDGLKGGEHLVVAFTGMKTLPGGREQRQFRVAVKPGKA